MLIQSLFAFMAGVQAACAIYCGIIAVPAKDRQTGLSALAASVLCSGVAVACLRLAWRP